MIIGLGIDLVDVRRIERALNKYGDRFLDRIFCVAEREHCEEKPLVRSCSYAKRFAAKEACSKALGTGIGREGVCWRDI